MPLTLPILPDAPALVRTTVRPSQKGARWTRGSTDSRTALGEDPLTDAETTRLLGSARDVAHRVERKITPLAAFLLGSATGRRMAEGGSRDDALGSAIGTLEGLLPSEPAEGRTTSEG